MPAEVVQAAVHGSSMEDEARDTLRSSLNQEPRGPKPTSDE
jgi:plasmid stability protein